MPSTSCTWRGRLRLDIARQFHLSPHTVRAIIREQGAMPQTVRKDKIHIDPDLLRRLYQQCDGRDPARPRDPGGG